MLTLIVDKTHMVESYSVKGTVKNSDNEVVYIGFFTFNYERALDEFNFYNEANGYKGEKQVTTINPIM